MAREHLLVVGWGGTGRGWNREKLRDIPICFRRITFITIKGGSRPTRLLPHAKMLLIPQITQHRSRFNKKPNFICTGG